MGLKKLLMIAGFSILSMPLISQTTLSVGDIAVIAVDGQVTDDEVVFLLLTDIEAGTEFYFTDIDADNTFTLPSGGPNGIVKFVAASDYAKGSVIHYAEPTPGAEFSLVTGFTGFEYAGGGDNITVYQGTDNVVTTFLHVAGRNGYYGTIPGGFTAITDFGTDQEGEYKGRRESTASDLFDSILNVARWTTATGGMPAFDLTDFRVGYYWDGAAWIPSDPGGVGSAFDDDVIVAGTGATFSGNTETNNDVYIDAGATLDIGANTLTADSVFIMADATGQGQVKGSVTGSVEFQSYLTSSVARWFNIGSPVDGALSKIVLTNGGVIRTDADGPTANANVYYYDPNTPTFHGAPYNENQGTWTVAADQTPAADANGWSIYLGGGGAFGTLPMTISSFGNLNSGNVNTTISTSNAGWNYVNNPYAGAIDFDAVITDNGSLNTTYYIRDAENGAWESYNQSTGLPANRRYIAAGQAFFVQTSSPTTLAFQEDQIDMSQTPAMFKSQLPENVMLSVTTSESFSDFTVVSLSAGASDQQDPVKDGIKRLNDGAKVPSIYTVLDGQEYNYKLIDNSFTARTVPVYLEHSIDDELTIALDVATIDPYMKIILEDKLSGDMIDLRKGNYTFRHLSANAADRFVLHLSQSAVGAGENVLAPESVFAYAKGQSVFVNLENVTGEVSVELYDLGGKLILNEQVEAGQVVELNSPSNAGGVYILKVQADGQTLHTQKIMK